MAGILEGVASGKEVGFAEAGGNPRILFRAVCPTQLGHTVGVLLPRRGYRILAQGFNPGNRPPGRRALKGAPRSLL